MNIDKETKKIDSLLLNPRKLDFFRHFIRSYHKNLSNGKIEEAHHDATAILLHLADLLGESVE